jgi:DNA-directed RNA polymerase subunit RPC12/RpoP
MNQMKIKCSKCGKEIPQEGKKKENYFVEGKVGEEVVICRKCHSESWDKAKKRRRR